jgi:hypothetical protein
MHMSLSRSTERSVLSKDLLELVDSTHHPAIYGSDAKTLQGLQRQLREERSKIRTGVRQRQRESRGKSEARGKSFPGNTEQPLKRKQALSNALKRVNKELERFRKLEARTAHVHAARRALELHRTAKFHPEINGQVGERRHAAAAEYETAQDPTWQSDRQRFSADEERASEEGQPRPLSR